MRNARTLEPGLVPLLEAILTGTADLSGAACAGSAELFDAAEPGEAPDEVAYRHRAAVTLCETACPALKRCQQWAATTTIPGVAAGRIPEPARRGRPRKDAA